MGRRDRLGVDLLQELVVEAGGVRAGGALRVGVAVLREGVEGLLEPFGLLGGEVGRRGIGIDRAVEREGSHLVGEELRVDAAESGAVREAEVGQLVVAHRLADAVHVACGVDCAEVRELLAVLRLAAGTELLVEVFERRDLGRSRDRVEGGVGVLLLVGEADDRVALADPSGIEADEVEAVADRAVDREEDLRQELDAAAARAAGVHQQRADALRRVAGLLADERERDRLARRVAVVEGHVERRTVEPCLGLAGRPVERARRS